MNILSTEGRYAYEVFPKRDLAIVRGDGATLYDESGRAYIDCVAGVGVASVGHANPDVARAIGKQARTLITCPGIFYNDVRARFLAKLASITPPGVSRAFLCNSGTEANEAAIKFAMHATGRRRFVCAMRGFHGRTMGALSATHKHRNAFEPLLGGFDFVPFNNVDKLRAAVSDETAAVIVEIVQGEGGVRIGDAAFFAAARELCDAHGALLVVDEVQTGFCRTGKFFACEHHGVEPDILCPRQGDGGWRADGGGAGRRPGVGRGRHARLDLRRQPARMRRRARGHRGDGARGTRRAGEHEGCAVCRFVRASYVPEGP